MKTEEPEPLVDWDSEHLTFRTIWQAANDLKDATARMTEGQFPYRLAALNLLNSAYEGFVNHALEQLFPDAWKDERRVFKNSGDYPGTAGKTRYLAERLGMVLGENERASRPYNTVRELHSWRDGLAHPRTVREGGTMRSDAYAKASPRQKRNPFSKVRADFVDRAFEDVEELANQILRGAEATFRHELGDLGSHAFWGPDSWGGAALKR